MAARPDRIGKVALVTGATGIIGPAICAALKRDGWTVAASDQSSGHFRQYEKLYGKPVDADQCFPEDLNGRESAYRLISKVEDTIAPIALLVNNAAINPFPTQLQDLTEEYCQMMLQTNFLSPLWLCQATEESLVAHRGSIINISSVRVMRPGPGMILYPVTKAAIENLTIALAMQLGPRGVRVNAIRVGSVPGTAFMKPILDRLTTEQARRLMDDVLTGHLGNDARIFSTLDRSGTPVDIAEMVAFLASPKAGFINGAIVPVEGGFTHRSDEVALQDDWDSSRAVGEWLAREGLSQ